MPKQPDDKWKAFYVMIGQRLRWAREEVYPSQAEFARALGVDKSTIAKIERGDRGMTLTTLIYAANKLRTGSDFLLFGDLRTVEPVLLTKLLQKYPELAEQPRLPARTPRPVFEPEWPDKNDDAPPTPPGKDKTNPGPARNPRLVRSTQS